MVTDINPTTVQTAAVRDATRWPFQRKTFYARGYHWAFYMRDGDLRWRKSADGVTWLAEATIKPSGTTLTDGGEFSVWLDRHEEPAQYIHIAYSDEDGNCALYYRRASISGAGDLTWTDWREVLAADPLKAWKYPTICVDNTSGRPIIGYLEYILATPASSIPKAIASDQTDGTWNTVSNQQLGTGLHQSYIVSVVPYGGVYVMAIYVRPTLEIKYKIYNSTGESWAGEVLTGATIGADSTKFSITSQREGGNATLDPKRVHMAFCDSNDNLQHISIDPDSGITGPTLIYDSSLSMGPAISTRIYGGDINPFRALYVFWSPFNQDEPAADHVCYKKSINGGANWTKEDGSAGVEQWIDETTEGLSGTFVLNSYFEEQHHLLKPEGYLGVLYTNKGESPDYVRFAGLVFADPDEDLLGTAVIRHPGSAELLGKFEAQVTAELLGKGVIRHSNIAELLGKAEVQQSGFAEFLGRAEVKNIGSAELLGKFEAQTTAELLGKFDVGQGSQDLLGKFEAQAIADLLGKFGAQTTAELFGKFEAQAIADLLGKFEAQVTAELLGKFEAQVTAELLGKFEAQTTRDLPCSFRLSTDDWIIQGVSVEAYIALEIIKPT